MTKILNWEKVDGRISTMNDKIDSITDFITEYKCYSLQGYLFSKALGLDQLNKYIKK